LYKNGERKRVSTGFEYNSKNVKKVETELIPQIRKNFNDSFTTKIRRVKDFAFIYLESKEQEIKSLTFKRYKSVVNNYIIPKFGKYDLKELKVSDIKSWINTLSKDKKAKTVKEYMSIFRGVIKVAIDDLYIDKDPFDVIKAPRDSIDQKHEIEPFSIKEVNTLIDSADGFLKNFIAIGFYTGMRTGEIVALKWSDVNFTTNEIHIRASRRNGVEDTPKTKASNRILPISAHLIPYIKEQYRKSGLNGSYIFIKDDNTPYQSSANINRRGWTQLLKRCGISYRNMYHMRHTFATIALSSGEYSVLEISKLLGHSNTQITLQKYVKYINSEKPKAKTVDIYNQQKSGTVVAHQVIS
jgi:integrase